ncbi:MAG: YceI family protein [Streptosporangiaceae bacterium]|nr:YceI family protein [Streptosporangiaceae bacterium]
MRIEHDDTAVTPQLGRYEIDSAHSRVGFRTRHLFGIAPVRGTFTVRRGTVDIAEPIAESRIHAEIDVASFQTGNPQRDRRIRSARFLDARRHPVVTFTGSRVDTAGKMIDGTLTVGEVTRPVSLSVTEFQATRQSLTARASAHIDRFDFGVTASRGLAGRYLEMSVEVQCLRT